MNKVSTSPKYYHIVVLVIVIFFVISFITNILNSIIADVKESFDLSLTLTGFLPFSFFIAYGVMSIPAGFLAEKYSNKILLSAAFLLMAVTSLSFVIFPGYLVFSLTLFVLGCCMAVLQVIINPMLRVAGGEEHFAFNSVLAQLFFGLASFASPFLYKYLVNTSATNVDNTAALLRSFVPVNLPWVALYIVFAAISLCLLVIVLVTKYPIFIKNEDERAGSFDSYLQLLKSRWVLLYFLGIFCYVGTEQGVGNWISQFLLQYHDLDPRTVGANTVAYFWAMLTAGCLLGLLLLKFMDSRKVLILATVITILSLIAALTGTANIALIAFPLIGFFISVMWSIIFSLALNSTASNHGALSGILCTGIAGGAIFPFIVGSIGEITSLKTGLFFLILPLIFILTIGFWSKPIVNNKVFSFKKQTKTLV
ncbi:sugar MFS transporter [Antarcticibacterium flavum]|uniref:Sugar MFS transporter n=1 Tax=Antarcticibacterium flavum TaxID=2058175 RepID=A0A5B7X4K3_9FLAO|nr:MULTISPECIES: MFS transporter [Antarcticibacterium]MCM4160091.1 MFS transporter [Antarcticibacterium sp. W02-3]QCY69648.1 sugar MFS transporter [Antarcticibacterium flavum]